MKKFYLPFFVLSLAALSMIGCHKQEQDQQSFQYNVDKFYDLEILRYDVPEFDSLSLQQKQLVYCLSEAALWGRDILFDQNGRYNLRIRRALEALYLNYPYDKNTEEFAAFPKPADPNDHWRDDLTPTRLIGSEAGNIIPDTAEMHLSYRFIRPDGREWIKRFLEETTGLEVVLPALCRQPIISDPENPYVKGLFGEMCRKWPDKNIRYTKRSCATDATRYAHLNLPTVIFGATGYGAHAKNERVSLQSLVEYTEMFTTYLSSIK